MENESLPCQDPTFWALHTQERDCVIKDIMSRIAYPDPEFCGNEDEICGECDRFSWDWQCTRSAFDSIPARDSRLETRERAVRVLRARLHQVGPDADVGEVLELLTSEGIDPIVATSVAVDLCDGRLQL